MWHSRRDRPERAAISRRRAQGGKPLLIPVLMIWCLLPSPAHANWFAATGDSGPCTAVNITDNKEVTMHGVNTTAEVTAATGFVRNSLLNPTALNATYVGTVTDQTDVLTVDDNFTDYCEAALGSQWTTDGIHDLWGFDTCVREVANGRCDQSVVRVHTRFFEVHYDYGDRYLMCHEIGHAIGLAHRSEQGCMLRGSDNGGNPAPPEYTSHDIGHFAANWSTEPAS